MRLKLIIAYDGRPFSGWQSQADGNTVQDHLEKAFAIISGQHTRVHGAGRTDAGVHAFAQCAHVEISEPTLAPENYAAALNGHLPREIRVLKSSRARLDFHARFSAKGKVYSYRIWNDRFHLPLELGRSWHVPSSLDIDLLKNCAAMLVGEHDFASFAANRGKPDMDTVRKISGIQVQKKGALLTLVYEGNGFLYKMVRLLTGSLLRCAQGRETPAWLNDHLQRRSPIKSNYAAPAEGLYLTKVLY